MTKFATDINENAIIPMAHFHIIIIKSQLQVHVSNIDGSRNFITSCKC